MSPAALAALRVLVHLSSAANDSSPSSSSGGGDTTDSSSSSESPAVARRRLAKKRSRRRSSSCDGCNWWVDQRTQAGEWLSLLMRRSVFAPEARLFRPLVADGEENEGNGQPPQQALVVTPMTAAEARRSPGEHLEALEVRRRPAGHQKQMSRTAEQQSPPSSAGLHRSCCWLYLEMRAHSALLSCSDLCFGLPAWRNASPFLCRTPAAS